MRGIEGKVALVTGAGRGIGQGLALGLAAEGAKLVLNDLDEGPVNDTVQQIKAAGGQAIGIAGSVTDPSLASQLVDAAKSEYGDLHIIGTCAGFIWDGMIHRMTDDQWQGIIDVHLTGTFRVVRESVSFMREKAKAEKEANGNAMARHIVTVSSLSGFGNLGQANYAAAKAGIVGLTRTVALEGAMFNIMANSVAFGLIDTRMTRSQETQNERVGEAVQGIPEQAREKLMATVPLNRPGSVEEAVGPMLFLASDHANYVSGVLLEVNGASHIT
ncbi:MAG: SDR family oxidoreductase [Chloroflexi bacterium]|nr:SDR family oxidoreductase [Chloroflexota bacterium]